MLRNGFICIFTFSVLAIKVCCKDDPKYVECAPLNCGNISITYPFYIKDQQQPHCGAPGFDLTCQNNDTAILRIPDNNYLVREIFYNNHSLRVANAEVALTTAAAAGCLPVIKNLSLTEHKFNLPPSVSNLSLFSNCSSPPTNLEQHKIEFCGGGAAGNGLAMVGEAEGDLESAIDACPEQVVAPVELGGGEMGIFGGENWLEVMKRGFTLEYYVNASECSECWESGGRCGSDTSDLTFRCFCPDRVHRVSCYPTAGSGSGRRITLALKIVIAIAALAAISILLLAFFKRRFLKFLMKNQTDGCLDVEAFLKNNGSIAPKRFTYFDIKKMTNSFKTKLGKGGHGYVYKGQLKDNTLVAVKILNPSKGTGEEFVNEIASISKTSHVNVVTLLGYCYEGRKRSLVYEFMQNGSLEKYIYDGNSLKLGWETLYQIALGIARGLEYLHRGCNTPILHFDIKPHNILLDANFHPKIADFGLAKLCLKKESKVSLVGTRGTPGFIAPEVFSRSFGVVSHKSDVYSYGMLVLEIIGKRRENVNESIDHTSEMYFPDWIYKWLKSDMEFNGLVDNEGKEIARKMIIVSLWCIQINPNDRPPMNRVVEMLVGSLDLLQIPPKPCFSCEPPTQEDSDASSSLQSQTM